MYFEDLEIDDNLFVEVDVPDDPDAIGYDLHTIMVGEVAFRVVESIKDGFRHIGYKLEIVGESDTKLDTLIARAIEEHERGREEDACFPPLHLAPITRHPLPPEGE